MVWFGDFAIYIEVFFTFLMAVKHFIVYVYHDLFNYFPLNVHLGVSSFLSLKLCCKDIFGYICLYTRAKISLGFLGVELLGQRI